jgi:hypothetical protein
MLGLLIPIICFYRMQVGKLKTHLILIRLFSLVLEKT